MAFATAMFVCSPLAFAADGLPRVLIVGDSARDTLVHNTNPKGYAVRHGDWLLIDAKTGGVIAAETRPG